MRQKVEAQDIAVGARLMSPGVGPGALDLVESAQHARASGDDFQQLFCSGNGGESARERVRCALRWHARAARAPRPSEVLKSFPAGAWLRLAACAWRWSASGGLHGNSAS